MPFPNPELIVGKKVVITDVKNGQNKAKCVGKIAEVYSVSSDKGHASVRMPCGYTTTIYQTATYDSWKEVSREEQIKFAKKNLKDYEKESANKLQELKTELEYLEKYESEEEAVADKLAQILAKPDKDSIKEVLKTMKKSNLI